MVSGSERKPVQTCIFIVKSACHKGIAIQFREHIEDRTINLQIKNANSKDVFASGILTLETETRDRNELAQPQFILSLLFRLIK